jgi:hypothetical protein
MGAIAVVTRRHDPVSSCRSPRPPSHCFGCDPGEVKSAPARSAPETPDRMDRTPGMSSTLAGGAVAVAAPDAAVFAVSSGAAGVAVPEVPGCGLFVVGGGAAFDGALPAGEVDDGDPDCCVAAGGAPFAPGC